MKNILSLIIILSNFGGEVALAQLVLNCSVKGSLMRLEPPNKNIMISHIPTQCTLENQSSENVNVTISLSEPRLSQSATTGEKPDPTGTIKRATLSYNNNGNNYTLNSGNYQPDTFLGNSTINMNLDMQIERPKEFFAGQYSYEVDLIITSP